MVSTETFGVKKYSTAMVGVTLLLAVVVRPYSGSPGAVARIPVWSATLARLPLGSTAVASTLNCQWPE